MIIWAIIGENINVRNTYPCRFITHYLEERNQLIIIIIIIFISKDTEKFFGERLNSFNQFFYLVFRERSLAIFCFRMEDVSEYGENLLLRKWQESVIEDLKSVIMQID